MKKSLLVTLLVLFSTQAFALTAQERGLQIIVEVDRRDTGFGDTKATLNMRLI
ncbi:MAG TPA: outer membrane lipoprotein-sorting protein, partial [Gammaproteobacteria bacterium]|nr:outer membrane lipoprotein-sorting protein [Gammaproteobacteria bacterium]